MHGNTSARPPPPCPRCGKTPSLQDVGTWPCRWHPGTFNLSTRRWSCCNNARQAVGCDRCDCGEPRIALRAVDHWAALVQRNVSLTPQIMQTPGLDTATWRIYFSESHRRSA